MVPWCRDDKSRRFVGTRISEWGIRIVRFRIPFYDSKDRGFKMTIIESGLVVTGRNYAFDDIICFKCFLREVNVGRNTVVHGLLLAMAIQRAEDHAQTTEHDGYEAAGAGTADEVKVFAREGWGG